MSTTTSWSKLPVASEETGPEPNRLPGALRGTIPEATRAVSTRRADAERATNKRQDREPNDLPRGQGLMSGGVDDGILQTVHLRYSGEITRCVQKSKRESSGRARGAPTVFVRYSCGSHLAASRKQGQSPTSDKDRFSSLRETRTKRSGVASVRDECDYWRIARSFADALIEGGRNT